MLTKLGSYRVSHSMVVAYLALFVALGGSGYAAVKINGKDIKSRSVAGTKLKKNTVTGTEVKNRSLRGADFKAGQLPAGRQGPQGPQGAQGAAGAQGAPGTAIAYARVAISTGTVDAQRSMNISQSQVAAATANSGIVCFHDPGFTVKNIVASPVATYGIATNNRTYVSVGPNSVASGCPSSSPASSDNVAFVSVFDVGPLSPAFAVEVWFQ
jgi:hypothetical protein